MRLIGVAVLAALLMAGQAMAADSNNDKNAAPIKWTGAYVGANIGGSWSSITPELSPVSKSFQPVFAANDVATSSTINPSGIFGGLQAGYNYQVCPFGFVGIETDGQWAGTTGSKQGTTPGTASGSFAPEATSVQERLSWFGTLRGRIGYIPINRLAIYATAGLAYGDTHNSASIAFPSIPQFYGGTSSDTSVGWTVGGGAEYFLTNNVSVKAEYLFVDLGSDTVTIDRVNGPAGTASAKFDQTHNMFRMGINYKCF
jgi:outer membrane immunogenic protein